MKYKASLDNLSLTITLIVTVVFIIIFVSIGKDAFKNADSKFPWIAIILSIVLPIALFVITWLYATKSYTITHDELVINRPGGDRKIELSEIDSVRTVEKDEIGTMIRTFGNGGLFGYYGKFYSSKLGSMTLYATQSRNRVLIKTIHGSQIMITPDDLSLVEALQEKLKKSL